MLFICSVLSIVCTDCEPCAVFINCAEFRGSKASEVLNVCTVYVLSFVLRQICAVCPAVYTYFTVSSMRVVQCGAHGVFALRWIPAGSLSGDAHRTFTSGIWHQWMGCGGIQTDMHTQTDR